MAESAQVFNAPEEGAALATETRWPKRVVAPQHRPSWDYPSKPRAHAITDKRLILTVKRANGLAKRSLDVFGALCGLIGLSWAFALVALAVWLEDGKSPFYAQVRWGRHGKQFKCWKFRSMHANGDEILAAHLLVNPDAEAEWNASRKLRDDPRVTKIGKFIRKASIDELPQLWNVLIGEMSLVGPRPVAIVELPLYGRDRRYYLLVRPGITGLWQISGRSNVSYAQRVKFDRAYVEQWSFLRDIRILWRTIPAVLKSDGAV